MPSPPPFFENFIPRLSLGSLDKELLGDDAEESLPLANHINDLLTSDNTSNEMRILTSLMCALVKQNTYLYSKVCQIDQSQDDASSTLTQVQIKVKDLAESQHSLHAQVASALAYRPQPDTSSRNFGKQPAVHSSPIVSPPQIPAPKNKQQASEKLSIVEYIDENGNRRQQTFAEIAQMNLNTKVAMSSAPKKSKKAPTTSVPTPPKTLNLPLTQRRAFPTRTTPGPVAERTKIEATLPTEFGKVLADGGLTFPHTKVQVTINQNGTVTCTSSPSTQISKIQPFFPRFIEILNVAMKTEENQYAEFRLAPTDVDYIVHAVPLFSFPSEDMVTPIMQQAILFAADVNVIKARFLTKPENRGDKKTTSVVITIPHEDTPKIGETIRIFGRTRHVAKVWHASPQSVCQNCSRLGHAAAGCRAKAPTCPICAGPHAKRDHRCNNNNCPKEGNKKVVNECCSAYRPKCTNCNGLHTAYARDCPARPTTNTKQPLGAIPIDPKTILLNTSIFAPHISPEGPAGAMEGVIVNQI